MCSRGWRSSFRETFRLAFSLEIEISPTHCRNLKYDDVQESRPSPTKPGDIIQQEIPKLATCNIIGEVTGERVFSSTDRLLALREERCDEKTIQDDANQAKLKELVKDHVRLTAVLFSVPKT